VIAERELEELSRADSLRLLASVPVGRLVFTHDALPAIRPVNHLLDGNKIVIGLTPGSALARAAAPHGIVVAYEADSLDVAEHTGWSVVVVGIALPETAPGVLDTYRQSIRPWLSGAVSDIVSITCEFVTGYLLAKQGSVARTEESEDARCGA
jgi:hypothetical protein